MLPCACATSTIATRGTQHTHLGDLLRRTCWLRAPCPSRAWPTTAQQQLEAADLPTQQQQQQLWCGEFGSAGAHSRCAHAHRRQIADGDSSSVLPRRPIQTRCRALLLLASLGAGGAMAAACAAKLLPVSARQGSMSCCRVVVDAPQPASWQHRPRLHHACKHHAPCRRTLRARGRDACSRTGEERAGGASLVRGAQNAASQAARGPSTQGGTGVGAAGGAGGSLFPRALVLPCSDG